MSPSRRAKAPSASAAGNFGRNPFYVLHGGYERLVVMRPQMHRQSQSAESSSVSRAGALLEAASQARSRGSRKCWGNNDCSRHIRRWKSGCKNAGITCNGSVCRFP